MNRKTLNGLSNVTLYNGELMSLLKEYKSPQMKIASIEKKEEIIRLKRGLYVVNGADYGKPVSRALCSNRIYCPSYLSLQWALCYYTLIPERTYELTAITTKRSRVFHNDLAKFSYYMVNDNWFPIGIDIGIENGANFLVASPEKALCDMILVDPYLPSKSIIGLERYLEEDLRFDTDALAHFNIGILEACAATGRKKNIINNLIKIVREHELV